MTGVSCRQLLSHVWGKPHTWLKFNCLKLQNRDHFMNTMSLKWWRWGARWEKVFSWLLSNSCDRISCKWVAAMQRRARVLTVQRRLECEAHSELGTVWAKSFFMRSAFPGGEGSTDIVRAECFISGTGTPETGRPKQKEEQCEHHPTHHDHWERQVIPSYSPSTGTRHWKMTHNPTLTSTTQITCDSQFYILKAKRTYIPEGSRCLCSKTEIVWAGGEIQEDAKNEGNGACSAH